MTSFIFKWVFLYHKEINVQIFGSEYSLLQKIEGKCYQFLRIHYYLHNITP